MSETANTQVAMSADGHAITPGMVIYVSPANSVIGGPVESRVVRAIAEGGKKLYYDKPDAHGYEGAKMTCVYALRENAESKQREELSEK